MKLYISKKEAQYLIDLITYDLEYTPQVDELKQQGKEMLEYLQVMIREG